LPEWARLGDIGRGAGGSRFRRMFCLPRVLCRIQTGERGWGWGTVYRLWGDGWLGCWMVGLLDGVVDGWWSWLLLLLSSLLGTKTGEVM